MNSYKGQEELGSELNRQSTYCVSTRSRVWSAEYVWECWAWQCVIETPGQGRWARVIFWPASPAWSPSSSHCKALFQYKQGGQYLQNDIWGWLLTSTCVSPPLTHTKKTWAQIDKSRVLWRDVILTSGPRGRPQSTTERLFYLMSLVKHTQPARTKCGKADSSPTEGAAQQIWQKRHVYEPLT